MLRTAFNLPVEQRPHTAFIMNFPTLFVLSLLFGESVASPNLKGSVAVVEETVSCIDQ